MAHKCSKSGCPCACMKKSKPKKKSVKGGKKANPLNDILQELVRGRPAPQTTGNPPLPPSYFAITSTPAHAAKMRISGTQTEPEIRELNRAVEREEDRATRIPRARQPQPYNMFSERNFPQTLEVAPIFNARVESSMTTQTEPRERVFVATAPPPLRIARGQDSGRGRANATGTRGGEAYLPYTDRQPGQRLGLTDLEREYVYHTGRGRPLGYHTTPVRRQAAAEPVLRERILELESLARAAGGARED